MAKRSTRQASGRGRKTSSPQRAGGRSLPGWVWGLAGLSLGLAVAYMVHLRHTDSGPEQVARLFEQPTQSSDGGPPSPDTAKSDKPRFEFYRLLPEQEVEVPGNSAPAGDSGSPPRRRDPVAENDRAAAAEAETPATDEATADRASASDPPAATEPADSGGRYLLQAGSFRGYEDADRMKAKLALIGVEARIQKVELSGGELWHRVRVGPFSARDRVNRVRQRLRENGVQTIVLKRGG